MIKIPKPLNELNESLERSKVLIARMKKGQEVIGKAYNDKSLARAFEGVRLFNKLAAELNAELEHSAFMHEFLTTGKTVLINREGRPVNVADYTQGQDVPIDLWTLNSIKSLRETFGEEAIIEVDFE